MNLPKRRSREGDGRQGTELGHSRERDDSGLMRFRHEMDRLFDRVWRDFEHGDALTAMTRFPGASGETGDWPAVDMAEDDKAVTYRVDLPGMDPKHVDVEVSGDVLTIRGHREDEWSDTKGGVHRRERRSGSFSRTLPLPDYVDADKIEARYDKGTMTLTVPKVPGKGPKRVEVKS